MEIELADAWVICRGGQATNSLKKSTSKVPSKKK